MRTLMLYSDANGCPHAHMIESALDATELAMRAPDDLGVLDLNTGGSVFLMEMPTSDDAAAGKLENFRPAIMELGADEVPMTFGRID